ncbi:hypothetical protein HG1285_00590 [Hydrogenivirga sp. 128-5-R1-1]|nr:hypothetical protein HG1285_00590 [Hydrogenivirga sp. 128-5-R1-1]
MSDLALMLVLTFALLVGTFFILWFYSKGSQKASHS